MITIGLSAGVQQRSFDGICARSAIPLKVCGRARQNNPDFSELARMRIDLDCTSMLLDNDIVTE